MNDRPAPLRIGILGASRIAESAIVGPAEELGHRLVAVAARDRGRATAFADKYGVERVLDSYADIVADPEVDVVYNPLANSLHAPWNLAAIRAGKPVLTEKPFSRNVTEALEVRDAAAAADVPVLEAFHYLFHPLVARTSELLAAGTIGAIRNIDVVMDMPTPGPDDPRWSYELAGGSVMDLGCYGLHVFRTLGRFCGGAPEIGYASAVLRGIDVDESSVIDVTYPGGATGHNTNSMVGTEFEFTVRIVGDGGELFLHDFLAPGKDDRLSITRSDGSVVVEHLGTRSTYTYQLEAFAAAVQTGAVLPIGLDDAVENMRYIDAAYLAAGLPPR
ncbi:Gfo/Idh/MocA family protein [Gordonia soli]|uniref:Putative oxidoreductase n=1 Tax=Gordonia soli NBRC 108243 TaxID=1223545 RepID=M0QDM0_9ACTN|nr:Gfo/Idh/MocA family oxidoreductase [Gordonia soli]GAC66703.1 putative oxidoreductase [Gordonia soli NBRC 108243]